MLFGIETEYAVTGFAGRLLASERDSSGVWRLMDAARRTLGHVSDFGEGLFLENGSRFYIDAGYHPELSTPECAHPTEALRYVLAGEQILIDLARELEANTTSDALNIFKSNVDYSGSGATWGCHESYMHRMDPVRLSQEIIPHLVSRVIYTGAGGFDSLSAGLTFTISPRVAHLEKVVSNESTSSRGIFHTKDEPLSRAGYHRLHLICGESLCSHTAIWLKVATTALIVAMAEAGVCFSETVKLRAPLTALRGFAADPSCKAEAIVNGKRWMTAIDIQRFYLSQAESHLGKGFMPEWAGEACQQWQAILDRLDKGYEGVNTTLDWAIKLTLYRDYAAREGLSWDSLPHWTHIHQRLHEAMGYPPAWGGSSSLETLLKEGGPVREAMKDLGPFLKTHDLRWEDFDKFIRLRHQLFEIDTRMSQLGEGGIFSRLAKSGGLKHEMADVGDIRTYVSTPPPVGRARVRGEFIKNNRAHREHYSCDWQGIWDRDGKRFLDLSDPFASKEQWSTLDEKSEDIFCRLPVGVRQAVRYVEGHGTY